MFDVEFKCCQLHVEVFYIGVSYYVPKVMHAQYTMPCPCRRVSPTDNMP